MIVGVGIDLTEVPRIAQLLDRWGDRFTNKVFTQREREYAFARARPALHLAARFSAKEALLKALCVPSGLRWHELEVVGGGQAPPQMVLSGRAEEAARERGVASLMLSLTHTVDVAAAVVIAQG